MASNVLTARPTSNPGNQGTMLRLSARQLAQLNMPNFCPACFWIERHYTGKDMPFSIPMPGVFATIDSFSKSVVHACVHAGHPLPEGFPAIGEVKHCYESDVLNWQKFQIHHPETNIVLRGVPDDILVTSGGRYHILDYKTARATEFQDRLFPLYEGQLNVYAWIAERLSKHQRKPASLHLVYFQPQSFVSEKILDQICPKEGPRPLPFRIASRQVQLWEEGRVAELLHQARHLLDQSVAPEHLSGCENRERLHQLTQTYHLSMGFEPVQLN